MLCLHYDILSLVVMNGALWVCYFHLFYHLAQLCPTIVSRDVGINTTEAVVVSSDEIDQPPVNCTSATFDLYFIINDIGFLTSIDILELRSDHPDLELVVEFFPFDYEWPKFVVQENTYRRFIFGAENPMPRLRLALNRRVGESHLNGSYSFRARVSLTSEAGMSNVSVTLHRKLLCVCSP